MTSIGLRLKQRRKLLGLTLDDVAVKVFVTKQTIQKYENGIISNIPSDKIEALAYALETTPAYIMGWEQKKEPATKRDDRLTEQELEYVKLYRSASPEMQAAALGMLEAAERARLGLDLPSKDK